jgi:phosphoglycolate phosphatase
MQDRTIQVVVIDMAGTTVADDGLVVIAFESAATAAGVPESGQERDRARQYVLDTMGQSKISVFRALFESEERAQLANAAFERAYEQLIDEGRTEPIDGAALAITRLREAGIRVALTTGFSGTTQEKLLAALGWHSLADLVLAPADLILRQPLNQEKES